MFISTQHSHTIASSAYRQPYVRTGYEFVIGKRTGKLFCTSAEEDGVVESQEDRGIIVKYVSGNKVGIELGRQYGKAEGTTYPHDVVTPLKVEEKFKAGDVLAYNTAFFEPDFLNPKDIILKINTPILTAMIEGTNTHEDSASLSPRAGRLLQTEVVKVKSYTVRFDQALAEVKKPGDFVKPKDILMIIESEITANVGNFSESAISTLKRLANHAPRAGELGKIEKIEVLYHGEKQDMSPSLRKLVDKSDSLLAQTAKAVGKTPVTGRVTEEYRVAGTPLEVDNAEIRFYISVKAGTGVGDKVIFSHQMKCTVSEVQNVEGDDSKDVAIHTEDGREVNGVFGYTSVAARGVLSPSIMGTTMSLLDYIGKQAAKIYFGD